MAKPRLVYRCSDCGATFPKWAGRCGTCEAWNTLVEDIDDPIEAALLLSPGATAMPIAEIDAHTATPRPTRITEIGRAHV